MTDSLEYGIIWSCVLDLLFDVIEFDDSGQISTKIYDKRDDFNFKIIIFSNMCSNIPASPAYGVMHRLLSSLQRRDVFRQDLGIGI
jgi:hypothetical protein